MSKLAWLEELERNKGSYPLSGIAKSRTSPIEGVVIHHTEGAPSLSGNITWAKKKGVGADAYILPDGSFVLATKPDQRMDHAGIKNISNFRNPNTFSIEVITTANGMPNAAQYKTTHGMVSRLSQEHGFDIKSAVKAHGEIAPGHKNMREGLGLAHMIRTAGHYDESNPTDYEGLSRRYSGGRPVMRPQVHPVDLGQSYKGYNPHATSNGGEAAPYKGDLPSLGDAPSVTPPTLKETAEQWYPKPTDPFNPTIETSPPVVNDGIPAGVNIDGEGSTFNISPEDSVLPDAPTTNIIPQEDPTATVEYAPSTTELPTSTIPSPEFHDSVSTPQINERIVQPSDVQFDQNMERSLKDGVKYGVVTQQEVDQRRAREARARTVEQDIEIGIPEPVQMPLVIPKAEEVRLNSQARYPVLGELAGKAPEWLELLEADFITRNTLVNTIQEAVTSLWSDVRNRVDPEFSVPTELLKQFPEQYHDYLLRSANAEDYVIREHEIKSRIEGETLAQRAWDNSTAQWAVSYFGSGFVTLIPYMFAYGGAAAGASRLVGSGASYLQRFAAIGTAEAALTGIEAGYGIQGAVIQPRDAALMLGVSAAGSAIGARFLRSPKGQAELLELADKIAEQGRKAHYEAQGLQAPKAPERAEDALDSIYTPRAIVDEESSIEVLRETTSREAVERFDDDVVTLKSWYAADQAGDQFDRKAIQEVFERQAHYLEKQVSAFIPIPRSYSKSPEDFLSELLKEKSILIGYQNASDVVSHTKGGAVVKFELPKGVRLVDMQKFAGGKKGSLAFQVDNVVPGQPKGKSGFDKLVEGPGAKFSFRTSERKLTNGGKKVTKNGKDIKFYQTDARIAPKAIPASLTKQWAKLEAGGARVSVDEILATNAAKVKHGTDIDQKPPMHDLPDEFIRDEGLAQGGNLSAAMAASGSTNVVRMRQVDPSKAYKALHREQNMFRKEAVPLSAHVPILNWMKPEGMKASMSNNYLFRDMSRTMMERGYNPTAKELDQGLGVGRTVDRTAVEIISAFDGKIMKAFVSNFNSYVKSRLGSEGKKRVLPDALRDSWIKEFDQEVDAYRRAVQEGRLPAVPKYEGISAQANTLDTIYNDALDLAQDPGKWIGRPGEFPPLEGFEELLKHPGYTPRTWVNEFITNLENEFDDPMILNKWLMGSLENGGLMKNPRFRTYAAKKLGISVQAVDSGNIPHQLRLKFDGILDTTAQKIADTMANTIKRAKAGWTLDADLLTANLANRKFVEVLKKELKDGLDPDLEDVLDDIMWKGAVKDADGKATGKTGGASGRHSHKRAVLNEAFKLVMPGGRKVGLEDFVQTQATQNARGYIRRMGGRIAWGSYEYTSPGGGFEVKGINSDRAWGKVVDTIMKIETDVSNPSRKLIPDDGAPEVKKQLDALWEHTTGNTPVGTVGLQMIQNYSYMAHLGNAGFAQASEAANIIGMGAYRHLADAEPWKKFLSNITDWRGDPQAHKADLDALGQIIEDDMGLGLDIVRGARGSQADERMGLGAGGTAATLLDKGSRFVFISSGLAPLQQEMQKTMSRGLFNKLMSDVARYKSYAEMPRRHRQDLVSMVGDQVMAERVFGIMKNHTTNEPRWWGTKLIDFDDAHPDFDQEAFYMLKHGIKRFTEQGIQTNTYGTMHRWFNNPKVRAFFTLKSFLFGSYTKQLIRHMREITTYSAQAGRDIKAGNFSFENGLGDSAMSLSRPVVSITTQVALGAALYAAMEEAKLIGVSKEQARERREKLYAEGNLIKAGVVRSGTLGLIPTIWNTPMKHVNQDLTFGLDGFRGSGLESTLYSVPALDQSTRALGLLGDFGVWALDGFEGGPTQKQLNRTQRLLSNQMQLSWAVNVIGAQIFELEPK